MQEASACCLGQDGLEDRPSIDLSRKQAPVTPFRTRQGMQDPACSGRQFD